jgi:hypothetical protein
MAAGALAAAAQWGPALEVIADSPRSEVDQWSAATSLGWRWLELMAPGGLGVPGASGSLMGAFRRTTDQIPYVGSVYIGASVLLGLALSLGHLGSRTDRTLAVLAVTTLLAAHGDAIPGAAAFWGWAHARFPEKLLAPGFLCVILLAARALQRERSAKTLLTLRTGALFAGCGIALVSISGPAAAWLMTMLKPAEAARMESDAELLAAQWTMGACLLTLSGLSIFAVRRFRSRLSAFMLGLGCLEAALSASVTLVQAPAEILDPRRSVAGDWMVPGDGILCCDPRQPTAVPPCATSPLQTPFNCAAESAQRMNPALGTLHGYRYPLAADVGGFEPWLMRQVMVTGLKALSDEEAVSVLGAWGIKRVISTRPVDAPQHCARVLALDRGIQPALHICEVRHVAPDVRALSQWLEGHDPAESLGWLSGLSPDTAVIDGEPPPLPGDGRITVTLTAQQQDEAMLDVDAAQEAAVVYAAAYRSGWKATVDGEQRPLRRANLLHMAVRVPPGKHVVRFSYDIPHRRVWWCVSLLGVGGMVVLGRLAHGHKKRGSRAKRTTRPMGNDELL